jgi:hypothetical protein
MGDPEAKEITLTDVILSPAEWRERRLKEKRLPCAVQRRRFFAPLELVPPQAGGYRLVAICIKRVLCPFRGYRFVETYYVVQCGAVGDAPF